MWPYIATLLPTIGMLFLLYVVLKHILEGDRRERMANAEWDRTHPHDDPEKENVKADSPDSSSN